MGGALGEHTRVYKTVKYRLVWRTSTRALFKLNTGIGELIDDCSLRALTARNTILAAEGSRDGAVGRTR